MEMGYIFMLILSVSWLTLAFGMPDPVTMDLEALTGCSCSNPKWCEPITEKGRKEQYAFSVKNDEKYWRFYDWDKLTTVVTAGYFNMSLVCLAHSHNTRVIYMAQVDEQTFLDPDLRKTWIEQQLTTVRDNYLDGLNFDYEGAIMENETTLRDAYTALVKETRERFLEVFPYSLIAVDVGWRPNVDERFYDYPALANYSDFLVLMAYDEQSQIYGECLAGPNCPFVPTFKGVGQFLSHYRGQIKPDQLVLAVPWFGISYTCIKTMSDKCYIEKVPYRGAPCSDSPGKPADYKDIHKLRLQMPQNYYWNSTSSTPFIMYRNETTKTVYQIHYDNVESLKYKYKIVTGMNLRGVGIFHIDMLDYTDTPDGAEMRKSMFDVLPPTKIHSPHPVSRKKIQTENHASGLGPRPACPCSDPKLCEPITDTTRKEVFAFTVHDQERHWRFYDWSKVTTVVMFNYLSPELMCLAHSHGARAVLLGRPDKKTLFSKQRRSQWVQQKLQDVWNNFLDGINFDVEYGCNPSQSYFRRSYTELVRETSDTFRSVMPHTQISVDVIMEATSHYRAYDYQGLAQHSDIFFIMAYDESTSHVGPNSGYHAARWAIRSYLKHNIPANKLVLGLPWYGDLYECSQYDGDHCVPVERWGRPIITQVCYSSIMDTLALDPDNYRWNSSSHTPYLSYKDGKLYQIQYDNPESLSLKYKLASDMGIRGVGMWHIDCLDYSDTSYGQKMRDSMFNPLPSWKQDLTEKESLKFIPETDQA
ncbi:Di-N-acetylchitobiase [Elysia marginata]|uniref:Di-N-acetylchitobiase n=1 Tax=Elysia marginata TaxID=1093978 RepID=A0AAV4ETM9_9GAST|nr:Di-N-acetylchitobiase [Elysia marginata]